jgi:hypothetical protein
MEYQPPLDLPAPQGKEAEWALLRLAERCGVQRTHHTWDELADAIARTIPTMNSQPRYPAFEDWILETEAFSLRCERLEAPVAELRAAFDAGRQFAPFNPGDKVKCVRLSREVNWQGSPIDIAFCIAGRTYTIDGCVWSYRAGWLVSVGNTLHLAKDFQAHGK